MATTAYRPHGGPVDPKLFTYVRYNAELSAPGLTALGLGDIDPGKVQKLDDVDGVKDLQRIGEAVARRDGLEEHFEGFSP